MQKFIIKLEPKPQSRPRFTKGRVYEEPSMTKWKRQFSSLLMSQHPKSIRNGAIFVAMTFYMRAPQSISKSNTKRPRTNQELEKMFVEKKSDIDNLAKAVLDASNGILFKDDGQIAVMSAQKLYSLEPRIEIVIERLEGD